MACSYSTVKPVLGVTQGKEKNWLLKAGRPLNKVHLHYVGPSKCEKGVCLRQVIS